MYPQTKYFYDIDAHFKMNRKSNYTTAYVLQSIHKNVPIFCNSVLYRKCLVKRMGCRHKVIVLLINMT